MTRRTLKPVAPPSECMHGYNEKRRNCAICHHEPGQCDYGDCQRFDNVREYKRLSADGRLIEVRPLCDDHAETSRLLLGQRFVAIAS